jgi:hypothetical protein
LRGAVSALEARTEGGLAWGHRAGSPAARLTGDREARRTAQETLRSDARARWAKLGLAAHRIAAVGLLVVFLAGVLALIDSQVSRADMWPWLASVYTVLSALGVVVVWMLKAMLLGWLVAAIWEGRDKTPGAGWLVRPSREDADSWIDERMISQALAHLGIPPLDRFFRRGRFRRSRRRCTYVCLPDLSPHTSAGYRNLPLPDHPGLLPFSPSGDRPSAAARTSSSVSSTGPAGANTLAGDRLSDAARTASPQR